jgi:hypothetical protein
MAKRKRAKGQITIYKTLPWTQLKKKSCRQCLFLNVLHFLKCYFLNCDLSVLFNFWQFKLRTTCRWLQRDVQRNNRRVFMFWVPCCAVLLCVFMFWVPCCDVRYEFLITTMFSSSLPSVVCCRAHVLFTLLCLLANSGIQHIVVLLVMTVVGKEILNKL